MRVFHPYGTKERLFEMFKRVNKLNETLTPMEEKLETINRFIDFVDEKLELDGDLPKISFSQDADEAKKMRSFGKYTPQTNELRVVTANRNLADILRTLAHELVHHKQRKENKLTSDSSETGSEHENEANALAGVLLREFGQKNPIIFE
jgi:Zn-dependent peptidase ImmA (M78 family)